MMRMLLKSRVNRSTGMALSRILNTTSTRILNYSSVICSRRLFSEDEVSRVTAASVSQAPSETVFSRILNKELPADIVYEDDKCIAFHDISPVANEHMLIIPRQPIPSLSTTTDDHQLLLGHLLLVARKLAQQHHLEEGYRIVINNGKHGCQSVYHLHLHLIGGQQLSWPPGV